MAEKKYYWLKLKDTFFEEDDIKLIEVMPNGKDYIIFFLKLQLKSVRTEGILKYKNIIPYTPEMLSTITRTNIDIVKSAIKLFEDLKLIEFWDDGTLYINAVQDLIGKESESAERVRRHRLQKEKTLQCNKLPLQCNVDVTKCNTEIELDIELELEKDIEKESKPEKPKRTRTPKKSKDNFGEYQNVKLTIEEMDKLKQEFSNHKELITFLDEYIEMKGYKANSHYLAIKKWVVDAVEEKKCKSKKSNSNGKSENIFHEIGKEEGLW